MCTIWHIMMTLFLRFFVSKNQSKTNKIAIKQNKQKMTEKVSRFPERDVRETLFEVGNFH